MLHSKIDNLLLKPAILKSSTSKSRNSMNNFHYNLPSNCLDNSTDPKHNVYAKKVQNEQKNIFVLSKNRLSRYLFSLSIPHSYLHAV